MELSDIALLEEHLVNAVVAWIVAGFLLLFGVESFFEADYFWFSVASLEFLVIVLPPVVYRNWRKMVPFETVLIAALPLAAKAFDIAALQSHTLSYVSAAALALLVIVELDEFTDFRSTSNFAVFLVSMATIALAGILALGRWFSDIFFQTSFIISEHALMMEFVYAAVAGLAAGLFFSKYMKRRVRKLRAVK